MKKTKLLKAIVSPVALTMCAAPMLAMTSCGQTSVVSLEATSRIGDIVFEGSTLSRSDFEVIATKKDGSKVIPTGWTCDKLKNKSGTYTVTKDDVAAGEVYFNFSYGEQSCTVRLEAREVGECIIGLGVINLFKNNDFTTQKSINIFAVGGLNPQPVDAGEFEYHFFYKDGNKVENMFDIEITNDGALLSVNSDASPSTDPYTMKAKFPNGDKYLAEATIYVSDKEFDNFSSTSSGYATLHAKEGINNILIVPEYIKHNGSQLTVSGLDKSTTLGNNPLTDINLVILPKTIETIQAGIFDGESDGTKQVLEHIVYCGSTSDWAYVEGGDLWQGKHTTGVWCLGDWKYKNFDYRYGSKYESSCEETGGKPSLSCESWIGAAARVNAYLIHLDYSLIPSKPEEFKYIQIRNEKWVPLVGGTFAVKTIYFNGQKLKKDTDYTSTEGSLKKRITVTLSDDIVKKINHDTRIVVELKTPDLSSESIWVGATQQ